MNPSASPAVLDLDDPGGLSIVVQGDLSQENVARTALHCQHWRELFPAAEIILSLSGSDILDGTDNAGLIQDIRLAPFLRQHTALVAALDAISSSCDKIALGRGEIPLPPIKSDTKKLNHINLQIAAAQNGLRHAGGRYILRVRSDLIFEDRDFLTQYIAGTQLPRGNAAALSQRVMISWLYTLNPYTVERLPLHFSDWFHFGIAEDVRALWNVPPVSLKDAVYYCTHPHAVDSSQAERLFHIRLADEQHLIFHAMQKFFTDLTLAYHNDRTDIQRSMDILADNFVVCDLAAANCVFDKYSSEFDRHEKSLHCITADDWRAMVKFRNTDYRITLSHKISEWRDKQHFERRQGFPRHYDASRFDVVAGQLFGREIVATGASGVLLCGPHVALPVGEYVATVITSHLEGPGNVILKATLDGGQTILAQSNILLGDVGTYLSLAFDITAPDATDFSLLCELEGVTAISVFAVTVAERGQGRLSTHFPVHLAAWELTPISGVLPQDDVPATAQSGPLFRVSLPQLQPGNYIAALNPTKPSGSGTVLLQVATVPRGPVLATREIELASDTRPDLSIPFDVLGPATDLELWCSIGRCEHFSVSSVTIAHGTCGGRTEACYYEATRLHVENGRFERGRIVSTDMNGRLSYGPYISLSAGYYTATMDVTCSQRGGELIVAVLTDIGTQLLAERRFDLAASFEPIVLPFEVPEQGARKLEVACTLRNVPQITLSGILIRKHATRQLPKDVVPRRRSWRQIIGLSSDAL